MNLRSKKTAPRRGERRDSNVLLMAILYAFIIGISFFSVFSYTIYLDGKSQEINKDIAIKDQDIYKLEREIQNLKIRMESYSRKDYIVSKIKDYSLDLRTPGDYQVVNLSSGGLINRSIQGEEVAYNR